MSTDVNHQPPVDINPLLPIPAEVSPLTDEELLQKIRRSAAGYRFGRLWRGDNLQHRNRGPADYELCRMLASWGGPLPERIDRLFRLSGRMTDHWDDRRGGDRTYGQLTIEMVLRRAYGPGDPQRPLCRKLELLWGDAVTSRPVEWLWPGWLACGVLAVLDGDPGLGKSSVALDLVARVTTGTPFPGQPDGTAVGTPRPALVVALEDSVEHVVKPRLEAAGADVSQVAFIGGVVENTAHGAEADVLQLPRDLDLVASVVREYRPALLVIDPLFAVMGLDRKGRFIRASDDQSVRQLTGALKSLAEEERLTILLIRHLNKARRGPAVLRGSGSVAISGQARAVLLAAKDPADPQRRILAMAKTNLGTVPVSLRFGLAEGSSTVGVCGRVQWLGESELTADDLLVPLREGQSEDGDVEPGERVTPQQFLADFLSGGPKPWGEVVAAGTVVGLPEGALRAARQEMGLVQIGRARRAVWALPGPAES